MTTIKQWPTLQAKTRIGKTKYWQIRAKVDADHAYVEVEYWQDNGAHQTAAREVKGKNIGRSNETTPLNQALLECESEWKKQKDSGYHEEGEDVNARTYMLPMLAQDFTKAGHRMLFPCYGQPKLDGFRCLFNSEIGFWSRKGKPFHEVVDISHLHFDTQGHTLDGELMLPKPYTFQEISEAVKKQRETTALLEFHIFDVVMDRGYQTRRKCLASMEPLFPKRVKLVPTFEVSHREHAAELMAQLTEQGHEGLILRSPLGEYEVGQRSASLQKYKEFLDEEFPIVDVVEGVGREEGAAIFVCEAAGGRFNVRPKGDYGTRQQWFRDKNTLIGRQLTVRFQNWTDDCLPRFPVGIALREDWDK